MISYLCSLTWGRLFFVSLVVVSLTISPRLWSDVAKAEGLAPSASNKPKLVLISLDGLMPGILQTMLDQGQLQSGGFRTLLKNGLFLQRTHPAEVSLTAPSHVSTMTCVSPGRHGVTSNSLRRNGEKVNGFSAALLSQPVWRYLQEQGLKVLSVSYVAVDGNAPDRQADWWVSYPDSKTFLPGAHWFVPDSSLRTQSAFQYVASLDWAKGIQNGRKDPSPPIPADGGDILVYQDKRGLWLDQNRNHLDGYMHHLPKDKNWSLSQYKSPQDGPAQGRSVFTKRDERGWTVSIGPRVNTKAGPSEFLQELDKNQLIWPDMNIPEEHGLSPQGEVEVLAQVDKFFLGATLLGLQSQRFDVVLMYQPLLDSVAHRELGALPMPFSPHAKDRATQMFVAAYETIDRHLAELIKQLSLEATHVMVFGDHGLVPVQAELNLRKIPGAEPEALSALDFEISGGMTLAYLKTGFEERQGIQQLQKMRALLEPLDVVAKFVLASELKTPWQYGDALGAIYGKLGTTLRDGGEGKPWQGKPHYSGNHGFLAEDPAMATGWIVAGPKIVRSSRQGTVDTKTHSLLEVMPTALTLIEVPIPPQCEKAPLLF